jgi:ketosteroid isomerase-like protein
MVDYWNSGDLEAIAAECDPHVVLRPDPDMRVIEGVAMGAAATVKFIEDQREVMGLGHLTVLEEDDFGAWGMLRVRQEIRSRSGFESEWHWSLITTVRDGGIVMLEFFVDGDLARAAIGLE